MAQYVQNDEAPIGVPTGVLIHDTITVANAAVTLGTATSSAGVPSYLHGNDEKERRYPKAVYLGCLDATADVWVTWDGQTPVIGTAATAVGVKVPPTYPTLRLPIPGAIQSDAIKIISGAAGGTPVVVLWEF